MKVVGYLGSLVQLSFGEGGTLHTNITGVCGECSQCPGHTGVVPAHGSYAFPVYTAQAPGCSERELSKAGPWLCALPRPKLLRFRFSGTAQKHGLGWACVLCSSPVRGAQATRRLASTLSQVCSAPYHLPGSAAWFPGSAVRTPSQVCHVSPLGAWPQTVTLLVDVQPSRIPGKLG